SQRKALEWGRLPVPPIFRLGHIMRRAFVVTSAISLACVGIGSPLSAGAQLTFDAAVPGTIADKDGNGTGFTTRLPGTGSTLSTNDTNLDLSTSPGHLVLTTTQSDINQTGHSNLPQLEAPGLLLQNIGTQDFMLSTLVLGINVSHSPSDQVWLYAG